MNEFQQQQSAEKDCRGHPEMDVGEDACRAATCWLTCAHAFDATPEAGLNRGGLYTADIRSEEGTIAQHGRKLDRETVP